MRFPADYGVKSRVRRDFSCSRRVGCRVSGGWRRRRGRLVVVDVKQAGIIIISVAVVIRVGEG